MSPGTHGFRKVGIVGLGLIGGSLALALRHAHPGLAVVGWDRSPDDGALAVQRNAVTDLGWPEAFVDCDLLVLATPVQVMAEVVRELLPLLAPGCVITDVGSTKSMVCEGMGELLAEAPGNPVFVGGHPMAGSERKGMGAADRFLFENAVYILTPQGAPEDAVGRLQGLLSCTGALFVRMTPEAHDGAVAAVSHMPHIAASAVVHAVLGSAGADSLSLSGGGFRDTTRIASGDPDLWTGILLSNSERILPVLGTLRDNLGLWERALASSDPASLRSLLSGAKDVRDTVPRRNPTELPPVFDVIVALEDQPGAINRVAGILGEAGLNIVDIEILRVREGFGGTLRIGLPTEADASASAELLRLRGFDARIR